MKKVILFLSALLLTVGADAQILSSGGSTILSNGKYNSSKEYNLNFSGKVSTDKSENKAAIVPMRGEKSSSMSNAFSKVGFRAPQTNTKSSQRNDSAISEQTYKKIAANRMKYLYFMGGEIGDANLYEFGYMGGHLFKNNFIFMNYGLALEYAYTSSYEEEVYYKDYKGNYSSRYEYHGSRDNVDVKVPVNIGLNLKLGGRVAIRPYVGLNAQYGLYRSDDVKYLRTGLQYGFGITLGRLYLGGEWHQEFKTGHNDSDGKGLRIGLTF